MNIPRKPQPILRRIAYYPLILLMITFAGVVPSAYATETETTTPTESTSTQAEQPAATEPASTTTTTTPPSTTTTEPTTSPAPPPTPGPQQPTGADSSSYTYNETTGLWENDKYTWDPVTHQTAPKTTPTYSYNPQTGKWDTTEWIWDAPSGTYQPNVISVVTPPAGAQTTGTPKESANDTDGATQDQLSPSGTRTAAATVSEGTGTSGEDISKDTKSSGFFDLFYNAFISNNISSKAHSGDALVSLNTLAGSALSGDATAISTVLNLLQSAWGVGLAGNLLNVFTHNIFGNLVGDLWLKPSEGVTNTNSSADNDLTVNASGNAAIENTITLEAVSGDATVTKNTTAGDATTGSATAIANIINAINSSIMSGNSFLGMLNIFGSLDGDILLPKDLINTLLAANTIGKLDTSSISNAEVLGEFTSTLGTTNNVTANANSGNATVSGNTSAGNATTGDASTNVTVLNLTGRQVIGKNALLVFVNVLGSWVGMIVDAPAGTTTAALGGGITSDSTLAIAEQNNQQITNNVDVRATSGDASVMHNTTAGDATTGDANAAVNILNLNMSNFALSDWFGVLFINVFGSWNGSFGIDTAAGSLPPAAITAIQARTGSGSSQSPTSTPSSMAVSPDNVRAFAFTPQADGGYVLESSDDGIAALTAAQVLKSTDRPSSPDDSTEQLSSPLDRFTERDWTLTLVTTTLGLSLLGAERLVTRRNSR